MKIRRTANNYGWTMNPAQCAADPFIQYCPGAAGLYIDFT